MKDNNKNVNIIPTKVAFDKIKEKCKKWLSEIPELKREIIIDEEDIQDSLIIYFQFTRLRNNIEDYIHDIKKFNNILTFGSRFNSLSLHTSDLVIFYKKGTIYKNTNIYKITRDSFLKNAPIDLISQGKRDLEMIINKWEDSLKTLLEFLNGIENLWYESYRWEEEKKKIYLIKEDMAWYKIVSLPTENDAVFTIKRIIDMDDGSKDIKTIYLNPDSSLNGFNQPLLAILAKDFPEYFLFSNLPNF